MWEESIINENDFENEIDKDKEEMSFAFRELKPTKYMRSYYMYVLSIDTYVVVDSEFCYIWPSTNSNPGVDGSNMTTLKEIEFILHILEEYRKLRPLDVCTTF